MLVAPDCSISGDTLTGIVTARRRPWHPHPIADGKKQHVESILDITPDTARKKQREEQGGEAEDDEVPYTCGSEPKLDKKEDYGAEDRPLEAADAAAPHHEYHGGTPLNAEETARLKRGKSGQPKPAGKRATDSGSDKNNALGGRYSNSDRCGGLFVVPDGLNRRAEPASQHHKNHRQHDAHGSQGHPVGEVAPFCRVETRECNQRPAGISLNNWIEIDQEPDDF